MSVFLADTLDDSLGNQAAQTGNLVHAAAAEYHRATTDRTEAGLAALAAARENFPDGDAKKAVAIFKAYAADPENRDAEVPWVEQAVRLEIESPDGVPIVIAGTLDQVRRKDGRLTVHDIKTGSRLTAAETVEEYLVQQAVYTLAARETLDPSVEPGGIIWTPGYLSKKKVHLPLKLTVDQCKLLLTAVVDVVCWVRSGRPAYRPSKEACQYCPVRPYGHCLTMFNGVFR